MTSDYAQLTEWAPDACTLPTAERPLRRAEFDDVFTTMVSSERVGPQHLRLALTGAADLEATVRDLAARETQCCSFFTFSIASTEPGRVTFDIEVPAAHVDVLDALAARAYRARALP